MGTSTGSWQGARPAPGAAGRVFWQSPAPSLEPRRRNGVGRREELPPPSWLHAYRSPALLVNLLYDLSPRTAEGNLPCRRFAAASRSISNPRGGVEQVSAFCSFCFAFSPHPKQLRELAGAPGALSCSPGRRLVLLALRAGAPGLRQRLLAERWEQGNEFYLTPQAGGAPLGAGGSVGTSWGRRFLRPVHPQQEGSRAGWDLLPPPLPPSLRCSKGSARCVPRGWVKDFPAPAISSPSLFSPAGAEQPAVTSGGTELCAVACLEPCSLQQRHLRDLQEPRGVRLPGLVSAGSEIPQNRANHGRLLLIPHCFAPSQCWGQLRAARCSEPSERQGVPVALVASLRPLVQRAAEFNPWGQVVEACCLRYRPLLCPQSFLCEEFSRITH